MLDIKLIQGDTLDIAFQFLGAEDEVLDDTVILSAYVTCERLKIQTNLAYDPEGGIWLLSFASGETINFDSCVTTYDLTLVYSDPMNTVVKTEVYQNKFSVLKKNNKVIYHV